MNHFDDNNLKESMIRTAIAIIFVAILLLLLTGCSAEKKLQRAESRIHNITERWPQLKQDDTIRIQDTIPLKGVTADTVFQRQVMRDTMVLQKERLKIRYYHTDSTVYLQGECEGDTVYYDRLVTYPVIEIRDPKWFDVVKRFKSFIWIIAVVVCIAVILGVLRKVGII